MNLSAVRGPYIDQSQSLNMYLKEPTFSKISAMHFYGWEKGLKTGKVQHNPRNVLPENQTCYQRN